VQLVPLSQMTVHKNRSLVAALAAVGASLIAVNPMNPSAELPNAQHQAVKLTSGEEPWSQVVAAAEINLSDLQMNASTASTELSTASGIFSGEFTGQISTAFTGFETGVQNAIDGGFYGSDDDYVEGLFPGVINAGPDAPYTSIGTLAEVSNALQAGDSEQAFSYLDTYFLETLDHTLKPLLSPLLDETSGYGANATTTLSIPVELSQLQTNLLETFGTYNELKAFGDATLSPFLGAGFGLSQDIGNIQTDLAGGDYSQALTYLTNLPSDVTGDFLNGFPSAAEPFTGLISFSVNPADASILQDLLVVWPEQLGQALTESTSAAAAEAVTTSAPDLLGGLLSF
jgi:hypothetical protein